MRLRPLILSVAALLGVGCGAPAGHEAPGDGGPGTETPAPPPPAEGTPTIDQRSYVLGGIGAFAEMVGAGAKTLALSAPLPPGEMDALEADARRIAAQNGAEIYREKDFLVTDLFPGELTDGMHVLLIYRGETLDAYLALKGEKERLEGAEAYDERARIEIARRFGRLLSYSDERIAALLAGSG